MRLFAFLLLEILLSPLSLTSFVLLQLWSVTISKHQNASITALAPLFFRWLLHIQGIRPDETTDRLMSNLLPISSALCWGSIGPTLLAANLTGHTPSFLNVPPAGKERISNMIHTRSLFFDRALAQSLSTAEQIVLLGAGYDTRLFKFCLGQGLSLFEVDQSATQTMKIQALRKSGVDLSEISFVSVDFEQEDWADKLQQAGFEAGKKSFFLWEGVTYYLTEHLVRESLSKLARISGTGSAIAFDVFSPSFISASNEWQWIQPAIGMLKLIGEPFRFGIDLENQTLVENLLSEANFQLQSFQAMGQTVNQTMDQTVGQTVGQTMAMPRKTAFSGLVNAVKR